MFGKLDWSASDRNHLSASFNYLKWISPNGFQTQAVLNDGQGVGANGNSSVRTRYGRLAWTSIPRASRVNESRFGWFKDRHADNLNQSLVPPETGLVQITVEGQPYLGSSADLPRLDPSENRFEIADTLTAVTGRHTWKAGFDLVNTQDYIRYLRNRYGSYEYADFTSFAQDFSGNTTGERRWQTYSQRFGNEIYDETVRDYDWFADDQFRIHSRVTVNYGMRIRICIAASTEGESIRITRRARGSPRRRPILRRGSASRWRSPLAERISRRVRTVYARYHSGVMATFFTENGAYQQSVQLERRFLADPAFGPVFPNALPSFNQASLPKPTDPGYSSAIDLTFPSPDYRNPYTQQGDVGIEHAFTPSIHAGVSYLWSRGCI